MHKMIGFTALLSGLALASPAGAQAFTSQDVGGRSPAFQGSHLPSAGQWRGDGRGHGDRRGRRDRGFTYVGPIEYQGDSAWRPDGFNDWWHERPERAYPRWMQSNQNCDRMWWGGGVWRC